MEVVVVSQVPVQKLGVRSVRPGELVHQYLFAKDEPDGLNFRIYRSQYQSGDAAFASPRHHHAFQQVRWTESGAVNYGPGKDILEGDLAYFPRGTYYGPQRKEKGVGFLLQLGLNGEHLGGPKWDSTRDAAVERLKARGTFENGIYTEIDPATGSKRQLDGGQALYEEQYTMHTNQKFVVPDEGYADPILVHPRAFAYYYAAPGVEVKHLGNFFDHAGPNADIRLSMIRLTNGGSYRLGKERAQLGWTKSGNLRMDGKEFSEMVCLYSPRGDEGTIAGDDGVEIYLVELPKLD